MGAPARVTDAPRQTSARRTVETSHAAKKVKNYPRMGLEMAFYSATQPIAALPFPAGWHAVNHQIS
jgi:hypothetical protein